MFFRIRRKNNGQRGDIGPVVASLRPRRRRLFPASEQLKRLFAPIGLDLEAEIPEEIALSIVAEIQAIKRGKSGGSLRERGSID